jgi:predicted amidohydrolase YtcJ
MLLVRQHIPPPTLQQRQAALEAAARHLLSLGVTSVGDMGRAPFANDEASWEDLEQLYDPAADAGALPIR